MSWAHSGAALKDRQARVISDGSHKELESLMFSFFDDRRWPNGHISQTRGLCIWELDL